MNLNGLFRVIGGAAIAALIKTGIDLAARRGKAAADMTPEERARARSTRETAKRAQKTMRFLRRFGR